MKKALYTVLSILSIIYIGFLAVNYYKVSNGLTFDMGWFTTWFDMIVNFGGVVIIFCFALVNFAGSPLKTVFFILLIVAILAYVVCLIWSKQIHGLINAGETAGQALALLR